MSYTNFCCRAGGSNLNAGTRNGSTTEPGTSPDFVYASGSWVSATRTFTLASGNPIADGVAVGDICSIFADGATATGCVAQVSSVTSTTIVFYSSKFAGAYPADGTSNRTVRVGGAWLGPDGSTPWLNVFPSQSLANAANHPVRVNLKNDRIYAITAGIAVDTGDLLHVEGYATAYGDDGFAIVDGGTTGASFVLLAHGATASPLRIRSVEFRNNGATGSSAALTSAAGGGILLERVVIHDIRGSGANITGSLMAIECEFYGCNQSNTANLAGVSASGSAILVRSSFHHNVGTNNRGVYFAGASDVYSVQGCIFAFNGTAGGLRTTGASVVVDSDFYGNVGPGLNTSATLLVANCNFVDNGSFGVVVSTGMVAILHNCGFGSGTMANNGGGAQTSGIIEDSDSVTYSADVTPWSDPDAGNFTINLDAAKGTGRAVFLQTASGYAGTVGYSDIGAAQSSGGGTPGEIDDVTAQQIIDDTSAAVGALIAAHQATLAAYQPNYAPAKAGDAMVLTSAYDAAKLAAPVGAAMTLTVGERIAVANEVEAQIIDEADAEKVLTAITNKIASVNPDLGGLTVGAIASASATATVSAVGPRFDDLDAAISGLPSPPTPPTPTAIANQVATTLDARFDAIDSAVGSIATPPTPSAIATQVDSTMAPRFAGLSTYAGGPVASVTAPVTVGTISDKAGYSLAPTGLDAILTTLSGLPTNFREWLIWMIHRFRSSEKEKVSASEAIIRVIAPDGTTVLTEQTTTNTTSKITIGDVEAPEV